MFRAETYVAFFSVLMLYLALKFSIKRDFSLKNGLCLGLSMGLCALSRQWGILLFPAFFLFLAIQWFIRVEQRNELLKFCMVCLLVCVLVGGWFYATLAIRYGSITAFNREQRKSFSLKNQPMAFYTSLKLDKLFTSPIRPNMRNRFFPMFYSEIWGDYWCYYLVWFKDTRSNKYISSIHGKELIKKGNPPDWLKTNYSEMVSYLGRVNMAAIFPTALSAVALCFGLVSIARSRVKASFSHINCMTYYLMLMALLSSFLGYMWFLIMHSGQSKGDTIKATYMIQMAPLISMAVGLFLMKLRTTRPKIMMALVGLLILVFAHNIEAVFSHY